MLAERYRLERELGTGPHTRVWQGTDTLLNRQVAVRVLCAPDDERQRTRLRDKARATGSVIHPGITRVYDYNDSCAGCAPFLVPELVESPATADADTARVLAMIVQLSWALHAAHRAGLRHGAISPGNVLESADGMVKLTDFGTAPSATVSGDLRALGGLIRAHQAGGPPEHIAGLIAWLTDPDPARRPADAAAVAQRAGEILAGLTAALRQPASSPSALHAQVPPRRPGPSRLPGHTARGHRQAHRS